MWKNRAPKISKISENWKCVKKTDRKKILQNSASRFSMFSLSQFRLEFQKFRKNSKNSAEKVQNSRNPIPRSWGKSLSIFLLKILACPVWTYIILMYLNGTEFFWISSITRGRFGPNAARDTGGVLEFYGGFGGSYIFMSAFAVLLLLLWRRG